MTVKMVHSHADSTTLSLSGSAFSSISLPHSPPFTSPLENLNEMALRVCCYSVEAALSGSPQLPREKEMTKKMRRGVLEGSVCLEFTQWAWCVFRSVTVLWAFLIQNEAKFFSADRTCRCWSGFIKPATVVNEGKRCWTPLRCVNNEHGSDLSCPPYSHTDAAPLLKIMRTFCNVKQSGKGRTS